MIFLQTMFTLNPVIRHPLRETVVKNYLLAS